LNEFDLRRITIANRSGMKLGFVTGIASNANHISTEIICGNSLSAASLLSDYAKAMIP